MSDSPFWVGVLGLQGAFAKHLEVLERCRAPARLVRTAEELEDIAGLIIPGGESTTLGTLITRWGLAEPLRARAREGMPIMGTCAGLILLAKEIVGSDQFRLGLMDITVRRNAFGRQVDSFEQDISIKGIAGGPVRAVFIRAPVIEEVRDGAEALAEVEAGIVAAQQGRLLALAFHPELTEDTRLHEHFLAMVREFAKGG